MTLLWGVCVGTGTGVTSMVLAAVVATRWFDERRGLVLGALSAANATGQLVFLPLLARLVEGRGWRSAALIVAGRGRRRLRRRADLHARSAPGPRACCPTARPAGRLRRRRPPLSPLAALRLALALPAFWVLAGTFFICGASTNGLIGTHLIAACHDYGIPESARRNCSP